jgi:hypothetical protein
MAGLEAQMASAGLTGSATFQALEAEVALYSDAVAGPALKSVDGLTRGLVALDGMGKDNQQTFTDLTTQIGVTFDSLVAQGKDGTTVMVGMKDSLQRVWEEEQTYGFKADDTTQALINQAVQEGIVGEKHKDINQQMLDASNKMVDVLTLIAKGLGVTIPDAATTGASKVQHALDGIKPPTLTVDVQYNDPGFDSSTRHVNVDYSGSEAATAAFGGRVTSSGVSYYTSGTDNVLAPVFSPQGSDTVPAMLTPGESVSSVSDTKSQAQSMTEVSRNLSDMKDLLAAQPAAMAVALKDAIVLLPRRIA